MKKITSGFLLLLVGIVASATASAQIARVQVIHNCADAAASQVDVYVNGGLLLNDFSFRTATSYFNVPSGVPLSIQVAPATSSSAAEAIYTLNTTLTGGVVYQLIASGIVSPTGYSPAQPFEIKVYPGAREFASIVGTVDALVHHGATDAPTVDVVETSVPAGTVVDDLSYGQFTNYLNLEVGDYTIDVRDQSGAVTVASYQVPLQTLNLGGTALTVLASGFLNPSNNSDGPAFGLYVALPTGGPLVALPVATNPLARVQVIHNSADLAANTVDVYVNGEMFLDDFKFRTATPFVDAPAGVPLTIQVAPGTSTSAAEAIYTITPTLTEGETYVLVANGIVSPSGYTPAQPFGINVFAQGREIATNASNTDVLVIHGSTDAPTVDVVETAIPAGTIVNDLSYTSFAGYLELPTGDYTLDIRDASGTVTVASFAAPLATLGLQGTALTVVASGFLNPAVNSDGAAFGLWVALPTGGDLIELPLAASPTARVQVIHNCADAAANQVDVYLNGDLLIDNFAFRTASPFIDAPAGVELNIQVAPATSTSAAEAIYSITPTLSEGETYVLVANGIVSPTGYSPAQPFGISVFAQGREGAENPGNTDVLVVHGATDAPTVDVAETSIPAGTIVNNLAYNAFAGYLELPTADYTLAIQNETGTVTVASYLAPLSTLNLQGVALTVVASGFLNPANNSNGPAFGLWVALPSGGALIPLPSAPLSTDNFTPNKAVVYPNPANSLVYVSLPEYADNAKATLIDLSGRIVATSNNLTIPFDVSGLNSGMYIISVESNGTIFNTKFSVFK